MRYAYPAELHEDEDGVTITFADVPGAISEGANRAEALAHGADALASLLACMADDGLPIPSPSAARGRPLVSISILEATKLALNEAMRKSAVTNTDLAQRLGCDEKAVRRLRDVLHASRIVEVERALAALGKRAVMSVLDAA
jgi:antitoxin HicB